MATLRMVVRRFGILIAVALLVIALAVIEAVANHPSMAAEPGAPWAGHILAMDRALAKGNGNGAARELRSAYTTALASRRWEGMLAHGDAAVRMGDKSGVRRSWIEQARQSYLVALFRARSDGSLDGVLRVAEAFHRLGDRDVVVLALRIADGLASTPGDPATKRARVSETAARLAETSVAQNSQSMP